MYYVVLYFISGEVDDITVNLKWVLKKKNIITIIVPFKLI